MDLHMRNVRRYALKWYQYFGFLELERRKRKVLQDLGVSIIADVEIALILLFHQVVENHDHPGSRFQAQVGHGKHGEQPEIKGYHQAESE